MSKADPWAKLWLSFYTTDAHIDAGWQAMLVGPALMVLAKRSPMSGDTRWIVKRNGKPVDERDVARVVQCKPSVADTGIEALVECGTLVRREDGALGWPNFGRYQETPEAERKRRERASKRRDSSVTVTPTVTTEARRQKAEEPTNETPPPDPGRLLRTRPASASSGLFHELDMLRRTLSAELQADLPSWGGSGGQAVDGIGRALDELGGDLDTLRAVVRHTAEAVASGSLAPVLFRRMWVGDGFGARLDAWRSSRPRADRPATAAELEAIAEANAGAAEMLAVFGGRS